MSTINIINHSQHEVNILLSAPNGATDRFDLEPSKEVTQAIPGGEVFLKLIKPGTSSLGRQFGMMLASADLTTATVKAGDTVEIINGAEWAVIKK